ncbi:hypothetical protein JW998_04660 [candidate division KSB1 bacterium]|nr:hypothetical protein [candidate division KSB1 bacterium]
MSEQELQQLVEKIVQRVLQRVAADPELAHYLKKETAPASSMPTSPGYQQREAAAEELASENDRIAPIKRLYTEDDIRELAKGGEKKLVITKKIIVTPAARDAARVMGIEIKVE